MIEVTKRWLRIVAGWCLVIVGIILIPLPGPGLLVILGGLALLSRESAWARRMIEKIRGLVRPKRFGKD